MNVLPRGADPAFAWTVGTIAEVYFTNGRAKSKIELKQPYQCKVRAEKLLWNLGFY